MKLPTTGIRLIVLTNSGTRLYVGIVAFTISVLIKSIKSMPRLNSVALGASPAFTKSSVIAPRLSGSKPDLLNAALYFAFSPRYPTVFQ